MSEILRVTYAGEPETPVYDRATSGRRKINTVLMGTWLGVEEERNDGWLFVRTAGPDGWVHESDTREDCGLKVFFIDVGQGDGVLVEAPGQRLLVDGGPRVHTRSYLRKWQYKYLLDAGVPIRLNAVFVSHFDADHYRGLIEILRDPDFEIDALYHNGIARFSTSSSTRRDEYDTDLGRTDAFDGGDRTTLKTTFSTLEQVRDLLDEGGLQATFRDFLEAAVAAHEQGRLGSMERLTSRDDHVPWFSGSGGLRVEVLGPVPTSPAGRYRYAWFDSSSHTRNGHSLVLKLHWGDHTVLLGGDLNSEAEEHLLDHYGDGHPFRVDVAKSCHHGSGDFTVEFMDALQPHCTVISSGDNESYAHPRADAVGAAGRYGRGVSPLVFSTELARSVDSADEILFGLINLRSDGERLVMAQMKEAGGSADLWDAYAVPYRPDRP